MFTKLQNSFILPPDWLQIDKPIPFQDLVLKYVGNYYKSEQLTKDNLTDNYRPLSFLELIYSPFFFKK